MGRLVAPGKFLSFQVFQTVADAVAVVALLRFHRVHELVGVSLQSKKGKNGRAPYKSRNWVLDKKETQRKRGQQVRKDTKYTGRKRKDKF